jgi:hypothetical protein
MKKNLLKATILLSFFQCNAAETDPIAQQPTGCNTVMKNTTRSLAAVGLPFAHAGSLVVEGLRGPGDCCMVVTEKRNETNPGKECTNNLVGFLAAIATLPCNILDAAFFQSLKDTAWIMTNLKGKEDAETETNSHKEALRKAVDEGTYCSLAYLFKTDTEES